MSWGADVPRGSCPGGNWQRGSCPTGVMVLRGNCPKGSCPRGSCPRGSCPRGSCPRTVVGIGYKMVVRLQGESGTRPSSALGYLNLKF